MILVTIIGMSRTAEIGKQARILVKCSQADSLLYMQLFTGFHAKSRFQDSTRKM